MTRCLLRVVGAVQGCGFRPHVFALARRHMLGGFVRNEGDAVRIELEGHPTAIQAFRDELATGEPFAARIVALTLEELPARGETQFTIAPSAETSGAAFVPADVATCPECVAELFTATDRRYRYPFISCARCGPRYTVIESLPFDRPRTSMASFRLCPDCRREYEDPADRRFHAQTIACSACGPRLALRDGSGVPISEADPLDATVAGLREGRIVAVKGLGGFHLACVASQSATVAELRRRKGREAKPFGVMVAEVPATWDVTAGERAMLSSAERPIVLVTKPAAAAIADEVAPRNRFLGVMLPYTPLHHLLVREAGVPLVMTSGNRSDEPIVYEDADALRHLGDIADLFLVHDRPIRRRCDDSVVRVVAGSDVFIRRSRGFAPHPVSLPIRCPTPILATGGHLKAVFALGRGSHAILSHHLGDLDGLEATRAYAETVTDYQELFQFRPAVLAHDLHPDYATTRYAEDRATAEPGLKLVAVQHHHAHMAACMAENGLNEPVIGVTLDGSGYGTDGTVWGGEFLVGDYRSFRRAAHLRRVALPGGERAVREPWRTAVAHLLDAGERAEFIVGRVRAERIRAVLGSVQRMLVRGVNSPLASSAGRLFDVVAALVAFRSHVGYEGQAAAEVEMMVAGVAADGSYPVTLQTPSADEPIEVDTRPLIGAMVADARANTPRELIARRFHSTLVEIIATVCNRLRDATGLNAVVLSGGCFLNAILLAESLDRLTRDGFQAHRHTRVPPGDGGLCLGQLMIAAARESCDNPPVTSP